jgi:hypothetical protein
MSVRLETPKTQLLAGTGVALMLLLAACGGRSPVTLTVADELFGTPSQQAAVANTQEETVVKCMKERGWQYTAARHDPIRPMSADDAAEQFGYGISTNNGQGMPAKMTQLNDPNASYIAGLSSSDQSLFLRSLGPGRDSCRDLATDRVRETEMLEAGRALRKAKTEVQFDPQIKRAWGKWSACMKNNGYAFADSAAARESFTTLFSRATGKSQTLEELQTDERATARADWKCQASTVLPVQESLLRARVRTVLPS